VLFTVPATSYFDAMARIYAAVGLMLGISLAFILLLLLVTGVPPGRALADAVSVITTGLVLPGAATATPPSLAASGVLTFGMVIGALGLAIWLPLRVGSLKSAVLDPETVTFAGLAVLFAAALMSLGFAPDDAAAWSVSALSTSGLPLSAGAAGASVPLTLHVLPCLIGGSALAAAGGIKIARFIVLGRRAGQEFLQLGYRRSVLSFRFRDRELDERSVIGVWVYFIGYVVAVFVLMTAFSFAGDTIGDSIRLAIGGLTSSGGLIAAAGRTALTEAEQGLLVIAMLLGRVEILTVLPALSLSFWRG